LFLPQPVTKRSYVLKCNDECRAGEEEANEPINQETEVLELPFEYCFAPDQHAQGCQENDSAQDPPTAIAIQSHIRTLARIRRLFQGIVARGR